MAVLGIIEKVVIGLQRQACIPVELVFLNIGSATPAAAGEALSVTDEGNVPAVCALLDFQGCAASCHRDKVLFFVNLIRHIQFKLRLVFQAALMVGNLHPDHVRRNCSVHDFKRNTAECHCTIPDCIRCCKNVDRILGSCNLIRLCCIGNFIPPLVQPKAVRKFHGSTSVI